MKVLIMTVTAGYGHNSTAKAMKDELMLRGAEVETLDIFAYMGKLAYNFIDKGYLITTKYAARPYRSTYKLLESSETLRRVLTDGAEPMSQKFKHIFANYTPDAIICTHPFAAGVVNNLKHDGVLSAPTIGIVTDYTIHPFWDTAELIEYVMTPSELLSYTAQLMGIVESRLLPYGIPINPKFGVHIDKKEARHELGLDEDRTTILLMGGSMGHGNMISYVSALSAMDLDLQIVCICGNNKKLFRKLTLLKTGEKISVYGFVGNVEVFMSASDIVVTKPGGLTVTESMSKQLPMVLVDPIPGQEERNCDFLTNNGAAMRVNESFSLPEVIYSLLQYPKRIEMMKESIDLIYHKDATRKLCDFVFSLQETMSVYL